MQFLKELKGIDFKEMSSKDFEELLFLKLSEKGYVKRQVWVKDRGDGRRGRVDFLLFSGGVSVGIEVDRKTPRAKSIFKLKQLGAQKLYLITKEPFKVKKL